jgi:hypothetical protein
LSVKSGTLIRLALYDVLGREVRILEEGTKAPGEYTVSWDGRDGAGRPAASGIYIYRLTAGGESGASVIARKLLLLR